MSIVHINGTSSGNAGNIATRSTGIVEMPSGIQQGDLLIANLSLEHKREVRTVPQGWSLLPKMPLIHQFANVHIHAYYKYADANEPNANWGWNGANTRYSLIVDAYRGVDRDGGGPWVSDITRNNWGFSEFEISGVSILENDALLLAYVSGHTSSERNISNTNGSMTRHTIAAGRAAASFSELRSGTGGSGSRTFNIDASTGCGGYMIALWPRVLVDDEHEQVDGEGEDDENDTAPEDPANLAVTATSNSGLLLSWDDVSGADKYIIERERWTGSGDPS